MVPVSRFVCCFHVLAAAACLLSHGACGGCRCQLRAVDPHSGSVHRGACLPVACGGIATVSLSHNALVAGLCTGALLVWRLRRVGYAFSAPSVEARPISVLAAGAPTAVRCVAVGREEDVVVAAYDDSVWVRGLPCAAVLPHRCAHLFALLSCRGGGCGHASCTS